VPGYPCRCSTPPTTSRFSATRRGDQWRGRSSASFRRLSHSLGRRCSRSIRHLVRRAILHEAGDAPAKSKDSPRGVISPSLRTGQIGGGMARAWLPQANPKKWDVWSWCPGRPAHGRVRRHPHRRREHSDGGLRRRAVLRPGEADELVSGRSHDRQRATFMTATGQLHGRLRAVSRGRCHLSTRSRILSGSATATPLTSIAQVSRRLASRVRSWSRPGVAGDDGRRSERLV